MSTKTVELVKFFSDAAEIKAGALNFRKHHDPRPHWDTSEFRDSFADNLAALALEVHRLNELVLPLEK